MMKDRRLQVMAENQVLMMRATAELLRIRTGDRPLPVHIEKLAIRISSRSEDLQALIDDGVFALDVRP